MQKKLNEMIKFSYTDKPGWSVSRYDKFNLCKRQYYYDYYAKHDKEFTKEKIESLKKLTSIPLETGSIVHDTIEELLKRLLISEKPINKAKFINYARKITERNIKSKTFSEIHYKEIDKIETDRLFGTVEQSLNNFLNSERFLWIIEKAITNKEGWLIEPPGYGETRINNLKAYCKVDFLFPVDEDIYIVDWKTGKQDERKHRKQLLGYSTFACFHFDVTPDRVYPIISYLYPAYNELKIKFNEADTQNFINAVKSETDELYSCLVDIDTNTPRDKKEFPGTENSRICGFCNYRELCRQ